MDAERKENTKIQVFLQGGNSVLFGIPRASRWRNWHETAPYPCIETDTVHVAHSLFLDKVSGSQSIFQQKAVLSLLNKHPFSLSHPLFSMVSEDIFRSDEMEQDTIMFKKLSLPSPPHRIVSSSKTKQRLFQDLCWGSRDKRRGIWNNLFRFIYIEAISLYFSAGQSCHLGPRATFS